jgi:hypothetical protein
VPQGEAGAVRKGYTSHGFATVHRPMAQARVIMSTIGTKIPAMRLGCRLGELEEKAAKKLIGFCILRCKMNCKQNYELGRTEGQRVRSLLNRRA